MELETTIEINKLRTELEKLNNKENIEKQKQNDKNIKTKRFRLNCSRLFLTYPKCSLERIDVHKYLEQKLQDNIKEYLIVQEKHKDGEKHIHVYLELNKRINYTSPNCLDINGFVGHYECCKNKIKAIEYLLKEDKDPLQSIDWKEFLRNSVAHKRINLNIEKLNLIESKGLSECVRSGEISLCILPLYNKAITLLNSMETKDDRQDLPTSLDTPWNFKLKFDLEEKQCHFWIYSKKSNFGKTTYAQELCKNYKTQIWNTEEKYQQHITKDTEIVVFDEYSHRTCIFISLLNMLMDGSIYITAKGLNAWQLNNKPLVIIFSNFTPLEIYTKSPNLPNLLSRIKVINLEDYHSGFG